MVVQVENSPKKSFGQISSNSMPQFVLSCSSSRNMHEQDSTERHLTEKVESLSHRCLEVKHLGSTQQDLDSSSSHSTSQSQQEVNATGKPNPHDQCASSDTTNAHGIFVQNESYPKHEDGQLQPALLVGNPGFCPSHSQLDMSQPPIQIPYAYSEPYYSGLFNAHGHPAIVQPQMGEIAPGRVPLPVDLAENGPIYVNAKQYHGILRRRQMRAKLEAQNKMIKSRKPYLHESRHQHAVNRVRGSGGRFLSTKKTQQSEATPSTAAHSDSVHIHPKGKMLKVDEHQSEATQRNVQTVFFYGITRNTDNEVNFEQPDHRLSGLSSRATVSLPLRGGHMCGVERHGAPVVR